MPNRDFSRKVVIITGAAGNLGSTTARAFQEAGARMVLVGRRVDFFEDQYPDLVGSPDCYVPSATDLTDPDQVERMAQEAVDQFGRIDVLVNTVGGYRAGDPVHETSVKTWDFMFNLNARTAFLASRAVVPHMLENGAGKIINIGAKAAQSGRAKMAAYIASKSAVIRLTESLGSELKDDNIQVNCILPGTIDTPENREKMPNADYSKWVKPEKIADVILFLASDEAREVVGAAIPVTGRS